MTKGPTKFVIRHSSFVIRHSSFPKFQPTFPAVSTPAIAIEHLTKVFPIPFRREQVVAVKDLSLEVEAGQVYGLLGPNGSGKSTTMKIVLGLVRPTSGTTRIFGRSSRVVASREDVGFLPENPY